MAEIVVGGPHEPWMHDAGRRGPFGGVRIKVVECGEEVLGFIKVFDREGTTVIWADTFMCPEFV